MRDNRATPRWGKTRDPHELTTCVAYVKDTVKHPVSLTSKNLPSPAWATTHESRINSKTPHIFNRQRIWKKTRECHICNCEKTWMILHISVASLIDWLIDRLCVAIFHHIISSFIINLMNFCFVNISLLTNTPRIQPNFTPLWTGPVIIGTESLLPAFPSTSRPPSYQGGQKHWRYTTFMQNQRHTMHTQW